ncbi:hypothetical protein [Vibrio crassostreae]|uniref:hypothetical protein n=1 Tax=Vibrio crassostreae TaxID=246167 RepID=UPI001B31460A|nr:hypothetical protein [Vibrio crassostreae]
MTTDCTCNLCTFSVLVNKHITQTEHTDLLKNSVHHSLLDTLANVGVNADWTAYIAHAYKTGDNKLMLSEEVKDSVLAQKACDRDIATAQSCVNGCAETIKIAKSEKASKETLAVIEAIKIVANEYIEHFKGCKLALTKDTEDGRISEYCRFLDGKESTTAAYKLAVNHIGAVAS